jgi:hypothetical protein
MIEPDINERMARFAPSQNMGDPGDDAVERAVAGMAGMPARPQFEQDDAIDSAVLQIAGERKQDMAASLMAASQVNPDQAARASRLGNQFGVGQDIALRNMQELERESTVRDIQRMDLMRNDPVLARYLSDRAFASEAQDDVGILAKMRPLFMEAALVSALGPVPVLKRGFERGSITAERGDIGSKAMAGFATPADFDRVKQIEEEMRSLGEMGILGTTAEMVGQNVAQLRTIGTTAVAGAAAGSLVGPAGTVAGGALGATAGVITSTASMEAGNLYLDLRNDGVNDETAIPTAIAGGFLNGVIEVVGMKIAAKPFQALAKRLMSEAVSDAIKKPTMRAALAAAGKGYLTQVGAEGAEEALQETVIIAGEEIAKAIDGVDSETGMREAVGRVLESFMYGAMGSSILGGIGPGANLLVDLRRASNSERQQKFFEGLTANNKDSRLAQRSPVGYERFLAAQANGTNAETIYVDGRIAQQVLAQSGVPVAQLEEIIPGIRERIAEAVETGGDVTIPTARFGAKLANTDLGNALLPHMRLSPDAMSATEAQEFATRRQEVVREAEQILAQKQETDATFVQQARQIEDTLTSQIVATGQIDERAARSSAQFMRDFYVTQAAALGISPQEVYERFPVRVQGEQAAAAAPLEQADQFDKAGQRRTDTPKFKAWFKESKAVTEQGAPLRLYRGAPEKITEPRRMFSGGIFLTPSRELALSYGPEIMEVFASVQKPLDVSDAKTMSMKQWRTYLQRNGVDMQAVRFDSSLGTRYSDQGVDSLAGGADSLGGVIRYNFYELLGENDSWKNDGNLREELQRQGFDGVISQPETGAYVEGRQPVWIVWEGNQLKSPDNRGTWSRTTSDIMRQAPVLEQAAVPETLDAVANVESAFEFAGTRAFKTNREFKQELQDRVIAAAKDARIDLSQFTPEVEQYLVRVAVADAITALRTNPNAVGWYNEKVTKALRLVSLVHPEIATDPRAKFAFTWALAVTSNGLEVNKNFQLAERVYREYKQTGQMPTNVQAGQAQIAINASLGLFNDLVAKYGIDAVEQFMTTKTTVKEVMAYTNKNVSGENLTTEVYGAAALGPKIGNGFFANLYGHFEQLTMDRWLMRTWGRWTGTLLDDNRSNIATKRKQLASMIKSMSSDDKKAFEKILGSKLSVSKPDDVAVAIQKASVKPANRIEMAQIGIADAAAQETFATILGEPARGIQRVSFGDELRKVGNALAKYLDGQKEAPSGPPERARIRGVMSKVLAELQTKFPSLTMSDLQALLWYPEKRLYDAAKTADEGKTGYDDNEAPDYANAAANLARAQGITDETIASTIRQVDDELATISVERAAGAERGLGELVLRQAAGVAGGRFEQAAAGPARGGFDPSRLTTILNKTADLSTFLHESAHAFLTFYEQMSQAPNAPARIVNDMDELLRWFGIAGATPAERIANWNGMSLDQKRKYHETFAYNFEIYLFEGKAPSAEMQGMFERFGAWLKRVYKSIRDDLNAIYRREFGEDLPILTGEVRQVMDRMLATDEQIKRQAAINEMKPQFQTQEKTGMDDAEWAAYQAMQQEAIEASITDMNKASMRQLQWLGNARSRILRDMQRKHEAKRKEVAAEVAAAVRVEPLYRAMTYLRTGKFIDTDGAEVVVEGPHRLDIKRVQAIYAGLPSEKDMEAVRATGQAMPKVFAPDIAKLGTGKYGMLGVDGLDPDVVAESFGYSSGDQMIRALLEAKPIKEEVAERTDAEMLRRYGDMNTPEAQEAEVQKALHNEARARMIAVEVRWRSKSTQPVRVMLEAAKQVARELIAGMTLRDVRPGDFIAAEARAARDASRMGATVNPEAVGQAAQTRAYNEAIAAGTDPAEAMAASIEKGAEAARKAQERSDALKAQYGADPQQALVRASRAQLYQNQLAAQALVVREEVAKQVKYLRRIMRDTNVKAMGAQAADQIAALLERFEVAPVSLKRLDERKALAEWLAQQAELGLVPDIAPEIVNEARRVNYQQLTVAEFRDLVDAIRQIEHIGKRERKAAQEKLRAEFNALKDEAIQSMKDVAAKRGRKARKELGDEDRKWAQLIAGYDAMQQTIGNILYVLDGGQRDGPLARMLLFTANDAGNQEATDRANATLALSKILDPIKRKGQFSARKLYFRQIDDSLSLEQRMVIALNYGNQSNIDRLLNGEKWTDEQVQVILQSLTEEQLNAVQAIWDYLQSFKPRVSAQERNLLGRDPTWIELRPFTVQSADGKVVNMAGGYYPAKYNPRRSSMSREMDESVEADRQMYEAMTAATTTRSYTKNRQNRPPEGGVLSRQMSGLYAGINEVIHDLAWRTWAMDANRLLRDKEFQTVINSIYGRETYSAIKNWVDATVRGERGNYDVIENIAIGVRRNVSVSAMGLKFVTAAIQVTGLIPATVRTGITPMVRAVAYFAANPRESSRIAREKSSFMRNRGKTRYRDLNEIANIVRGESRARRAYLANAYALIGLQQGMVDMSVWWASYSKAIKEGKPEDVAVSIADQTVIDTQGSGMLKDLSQAMRGGQKQSAYAKLFTSFYQFSNTQYSLLSAQLRTAPSMGKAAADAFAILVVGAFFEEMLRTLLKPSPEDEEPEKLAKALIANQIDFVIGLPFGGGELRGIGDIIVGEQAMQYRGPSGLRMVGEARTFAGQTLQGEFDRAWTRSAINMSGLIWGIPSAQINDTIDGIEAAVEGEVEGVEAALAPITGVRR